MGSKRNRNFSRWYSWEHDMEQGLILTFAGFTGVILVQPLMAVNFLKQSKRQFPHL